MATVKPAFQIRKHAAAFSDYRNGRSGLRYYAEVTVFAGDSIERILEEHPLIDGMYHVEVLVGKRYDYLIGGDLKIDRKAGTHEYVPHPKMPGTEIPALWCLITCDKLRHSKLSVDRKEEEVDWVGMWKLKVALVATRTESVTTE